MNVAVGAVSPPLWSASPRRHRAFFLLGGDHIVRKRKFTIKEDEYIRMNYPKYSLNDIATELGRSKSSVQSRVKSLGLKDDRPAAVMTSEELLESADLNDRDGDTLRRLIELRDMLHDNLFSKDTPTTIIAKLSKEYRDTIQAIHEMTETKPDEGGESKLEALFAEFESDAR